MNKHLFPVDKGCRVVRLLILERDEQHRGRWHCLCDCGTRKSVRHDHLREGRVRSCGCLKTTNPNHTTHGLSHTPEYAIWSKIRGRCLNLTDAAYASYGGRGITLDHRWDDFAAFYTDMGPRPSHLHEIDRIDNDGPYSPENCRWATKSEQANNKRNTVWIEYRGARLTLTDAVRMTGLRRKTLRQRIYYGWSGERIIDTPLGPSRHRK